MGPFQVTRLRYIITLWMISKLSLTKLVIIILSNNYCVHHNDLNVAIHKDCVLINNIMVIVQCCAKPVYRYYSAYRVLLHIYIEY